jgi:hypothetical protein
MIRSASRAAWRRAAESGLLHRFSSSTAAASLQLHQEANLMREAIMDHQWSSVVISGHQWSSEVISGSPAASRGEPWLPQPSVPPPLRAPP